MRARTPIPWTALVGSMAILGAACGGGGGDVADPTAETFETVASTDPLFTRTSEGDGSADPTEVPPEIDDADPTTETDVDSASPPDSEPVSTPATVPDTGVPGIDSEDLFCRSWSEFAGSFQALAGAWAIGDPTEAARSEVAASGAILDAVSGLDEGLPVELETERASLAILVEPLSRRADAGRQELLGSGISEDGIEALAAAWLATLIEVGVDDPSIAIVVPPQVDAAAFGVAATAFFTARPPITEDPSLITDAQVPMTEQFLVANCPDQGTLGGNDDVGG